VVKTFIIVINVTHVLLFNIFIRNKIIEIEIRNKLEIKSPHIDLSS